MNTKLLDALVDKGASWQNSPGEPVIHGKLRATANRGYYSFDGGRGNRFVLWHEDIDTTEEGVLIPAGQQVAFMMAS